MKTPKIEIAKIEGDNYNVAYKVVTSDMKSLGLRKNPHIITYEFNEWLWLSSENVEKGNGDFGGIWAARTPGGARKYQKYMADKYGQETLAFKSLIGKVLYVNPGRVKTDGICLIERMNLM